MKKSIKYLIFAISILTFSLGFSQERGIELIKKNNSKRIEFLKEHKRIKVKTTDGKTYNGRFTIIDNKTIMINKITLTLDSIVKIKNQALFGTIVSKVLISIGVITIGGIAISTAVKPSGNDGIGVAVLGVSGILVGGSGAIIPLSKESHKIEKWEYKIIL